MNVVFIVCYSYLSAFVALGNKAGDLLSIEIKQSNNF